MPPNNFLLFFKFAKRNNLCKSAITVTNMSNSGMNNLNACLHQEKVQGNGTVCNVNSSVQPSNGKDQAAPANLSINSSMTSNQVLTNWIKLNVGGQHFVTTTSTLSKYPQSFLYRLCQEHPDLNSDKVCL